jgi:hypothetical protein
VTRFGVDQQTFGFGLVAIVAALVIARRSQLIACFSQAANSNADRLEGGPVRERWAALLVAGGVAPTDTVGAQQ